MRSTYRIWGLLITLFCWYSFTNAQSSFNVSGKVVDEKQGTPLAFAYVKLENHPVGTVTDEHGVFSLQMPGAYKNGTLIFSYLGYTNKTYKVSELINQENLVFKLTPSTSVLQEVEVIAEKTLAPDKIIKKAIKRIPKNYLDQPTYLNAYYRETITENEAHIAYADAVCKIHYAPYDINKYKWKDYYLGRNTFSSLSNYYIPTSESLHRLHFHNRSGKNDRAKIIDARSSDQLSKHRMNQTIECGPMGLMAKDKVKYHASFLNLKKMKHYQYELIGRRKNEAGDWYYIINFEPSYTVEELEAMKDNPQYYYLNSRKALSGTIHVTEDDFAITHFECYVPNRFKKYFCSYTTMAIKHFGYKVQAYYEKHSDGKYYPTRIREEDEFIYVDTLDHSTTPYSAVNEIIITDVLQDSVKLFSPEETFANISFNHIFDLPTEYNSDFWIEYSEQNPQFKIPEAVRKDMESKKPLEKQFSDKHIRDVNLKPPVADKIPVSSTIHGDTRVDNYAWLKDTKDPIRNEQVMEYIDAENNYAQNYFIPLRKMQRGLFMEMMTYVDQGYESIPNKIDNYLYHYTYSEKQEHPVYYRSNLDTTGKIVLLDINELAKNRDGYFSAGSIQPSPTHELFSYFENTSGNDSYTVRFKNVSTGALIADSLKDVGNLVWVNDSLIIYSMQDKKTFRAYKVMAHNLRTPQKDDLTLFVEKDPRFSVGIGISKKEEYVFVSSGSSNSSEVMFFPGDAKITKESIPTLLKMIEPRSMNHLYGVSYYDGKLNILSNWKNKNYSVFTTPVEKPEKSHWKTFIDNKNDVPISGFYLFDNYIAITEKVNAQDEIKIIDRKTNKEHYIKFKDDVYSVYLDDNPDRNTDLVRIGFDAPNKKEAVYDYNMANKELKVVREKKLEKYQERWIKSKRVWATARDGSKIPITLIYHDIWHKSKNYQPKKVFLTSYGAYGNGLGGGFSINPLPLIHKGFVYAIAHVRGGDELGRDWYDGGRLLNKKNTFTDFIDCAEYLIDEGYVEKGNIVAQGGSAGGLLMGAVANMRPDLFKIVILDVPFVDVINTMLDDKLPLTTMEYFEWGNPNKKKYYDYIKSYSPYDNVKKQDYPHMIFLTGLKDSRVGYWEPAKMVAKLREHNTADTEILLKTELKSGHGGEAGRFSYYQSLSYKYAIIMDIFEKERVKRLEEAKKEEK